MKNLVKIKNSIAVIIVLSCLVAWTPEYKPSKTFYELTVYHYSNAAQEKIIEDYLQQALLPALHRMKISQVGVFKALANDTANPKSLFVLVPMHSAGMVTQIHKKLLADKNYQSAGASYINAPFSTPPYDRMEKILLEAFPMAPKPALPLLKAPKKERVYELRSYESATEKLFQNKVQMFNEGGEIDLFKKLNFNAIFYSKVIAGSKMPNLMYMTSFENMADRDAHWKTFGSDSTWKKLSAMPAYQHNVSHIDITFLHPVDYSDF